MANTTKKFSKKLNFHLIFPLCDVKPMKLFLFWLQLHWYFIYIYIYIYIQTHTYLNVFGWRPWIVSFSESLSGDIWTIVKMVKKISYTSPSAFDHFASHLTQLLKITSEMVEITSASIKYFLHHLDPDVRKKPKDSKVFI